MGFLDSDSDDSSDASSSFGKKKAPAPAAKPPTPAANPKKSFLDSSSDESSFGKKKAPAPAPGPAAKPKKSFLESSSDESSSVVNKRPPAPAPAPPPASNPPALAPATTPKKSVLDSSSSDESSSVKKKAPAPAPPPAAPAETEKPKKSFLDSSNTSSSSSSKKRAQVPAPPAPAPGPPKKGFLSSSSDSIGSNKKENKPPAPAPAPPATDTNNTETPHTNNTETPQPRKEALGSSSSSESSGTSGKKKAPPAPTPAPPIKTPSPTATTEAEEAKKRDQGSSGSSSGETSSSKKKPQAPAPAQQPTTTETEQPDKSSQSSKRSSSGGSSSKKESETPQDTNRDTHASETVQADKGSQGSKSSGSGSSSKSSKDQLPVETASENNQPVYSETEEPEKTSLGSKSRNSSKGNSQVGNKAQAEAPKDDYLAVNTTETAQQEKSSLSSKSRNSSKKSTSDEKKAETSGDNNAAPASQPTTTEAVQPEKSSISSKSRNSSQGSSSKNKPQPQAQTSSPQTSEAATSGPRKRTLDRSDGSASSGLRSSDFSSTQKEQAASHAATSHPDGGAAVAGASPQQAVMEAAPESSKQAGNGEEEKEEIISPEEEKGGVGAGREERLPAAQQQSGGSDSQDDFDSDEEDPRQKEAHREESTRQGEAMYEEVVIEEDPVTGERFIIEEEVVIEYEEEEEEEEVIVVLVEDDGNKSGAPPPPPPPFAHTCTNEASDELADLILQVQQQHARERRGGRKIGFLDPHVTDRLEYFQFKDSALSVNQVDHIAEEHNQLPWYEQDYEELPWYLQPDLDEDGAVTPLSKKVLMASEDGVQNRLFLEERAQRLEARVRGYENRLDLRHQQQQVALAAEQIEGNGASGPSGGSARPGAPPIPSPAKLVMRQSTSSLITGPESVGSDSSNGARESMPSHGSGDSQHMKQRAFLAQSERPNMQNIPQEDIFSLGRQSWSVVDSGYKPKKNSLQQASNVESPQQLQQLRQGGQKHHSIAAIPKRQRWSVVDSGYKPRSSANFHQQQAHPQRHSVAVSTPKHRLSVPRNVQKYPQQRQQQPPQSFIYASDHRTSSLSPIPGSSPNSVTESDSIALEYSVKLNDKDEQSEYSVPFDEPYEREIFQDEYYYEAVKNRGKRTKPRRMSTDPPPSPMLAQTRPQPRGMKRVISKVFVNRNYSRDRNMSELSNVSSAVGLSFSFGDPQTGAPNGTPTLSVKKTKSFPPPELERAIKHAQVQQEKMARNPTPIPDFVQAELEELEKQWKAYSNSTSPATSSSETVFTDDRLLSTTSESAVSIESKPGSTRQVQFSSENLPPLTEEERNHMMEMKRANSTGESDTTPTTHALKHFHDLDSPEEPTTLAQKIWNNLAGILICLILMGVWILVLVVCLGVIARPDYYQNKNGGSKDTINATSTFPPEAGNGTSVANLEELLPSSTWDAIQQNGDSPQWKAWDWLEKLDTQSYSSEELVQKFALATLYFATKNWFNEDGEECAYNTGLVCNSVGVVTQIYLNNRDLEGTIPPEIGLLSNLLNLNLGSNPQLTGTIPSELGLLTLLTSLDLSESDLTGAVPSQIGLLAVLSWLSLANQNPDDAAVARNTGVNRKLGSTLPTELGLITSLQHLRFEENRFVGSIPSELGNLQKLQTLVLRQNLLSGDIPMELGELEQLQGLDCNFNKLSGSLPDKLSQLPNLMELHLMSNELSGPLPESLSDLSDTLTWLSLSDNSFTGTLPLSWFKLSKLQVLQLEDNPGLTGTIPIEWGIDWTELLRIWMYETSIEGKVPVGLCFLKDDPEYPLQSIGVDCDAVACTCGCLCA